MTAPQGAVLKVPGSLRWALIGVGALAAVLGMFGAELGLVIPAAAGLDQWWALVVFPVIGATGGALGGYFGLDRNNQVEASTAILAISIALVVPSVVLTVALRSYDADDDNPAADGDPSVTVTDDAEASARRRSQSIARAADFR